MGEPPRNEFERAAEQQGESGLVPEFLAFLSENKKWWLLPILIILLVMGAVLVLSGTAVAPFIYTLF